MSPLDSTEERPGIFAPKPKMDIYTVMLGMSLAAVLVAIILLWLEWSSYS